MYFRSWNCSKFASLSWVLFFLNSVEELFCVVRFAKLPGKIGPCISPWCPLSMSFCPHVSVITDNLKSPAEWCIAVSYIDPHQFACFSSFCMWLCCVALTPWCVSCQQPCTNLATGDTAATVTDCMTPAEGPVVKQRRGERCKQMSLHHA